MAGPTAQELKFILSMQDQASAQLKQWIKSLGDAGKGADDAAGKTDNFGTKLDDLVDKAQKAATAVAGVWASNKLAQSTIAAFSEYEQGMFGIQRTTGQTADQLQQFESQFNDLKKSLGSVDTHSLEHFASIAGQLGLRGSKDILTFTKTMGELATVFPDVGEEGAIAVGRLLNATGDLHENGVKAVTEFTDALVYTQGHTKATAGELVEFTSAIATNTQGFKIASTALLGMGATAAQTGLQVQTTGSTIGQALRALRDAAINGSVGMQLLTQQTGITAAQFRTMIAQHPEKAFQVLLQAVNQLNKSGQSATPLLDALGIGGTQSNQVLGTLASQLDVMKAKIADAGKAANENKGVLDSMFAEWQKSTASHTAALSNAFSGVATDIGRALSPVYNLITVPLTGALNLVDSAFRGTASWGQTLAASLLVGVPAVTSLVTGLKLLGPLLLSTGTQLVTLGGLFPGVATSIKFVATSFLSLSGVMELCIAALAALTSPFVLAGAAIAAVALTIWAAWDHLPDWFTGTLKKAWDVLTGWYESAKNYVASWFKSDADKPKLELGGVDQASVEKTKEEAQKHAEEIAQQAQAALTQQMQALSSLNPNISARGDIGNGERAIAQARAVLNGAKSAQVTTQNGIFTVTDEDVKRAERILEYRKQVANDPLFEQSQDLDRQIAQAAALTADRKNALTVEQQIRDTVNKTGETYDQVNARIGTQLRQLQQVQQASALNDQLRGIQDQFRTLGAVTAQEQSRAQIVKTINDFEREHGTLLDAQRAKLADMLATYNQQVEALRLLNSLDPRAAAEQRYQSEQKTLDTLREQGKISEELYRTDSARLAYNKQQNDPTTKHIQDLRDQLRISQLYGDQQKIEQTVLEETNTLRQNGVKITDDLAAAVRRYAVAKNEADKAQTSGLEGWARQQGTIQDNLNKIQSDFADGMADAVSGALSGQRGGFRTALANLGKNLLNSGVRQLFAQAIQGFSTQGQAATNQAQSALNQIESLSKSGINSPQATITATQAIINASNVTGGTQAGYAPKNGDYASQNGSQPQTVPYTVQPNSTVPSATSVLPSSSGVSTPSISGLPSSGPLSAGNTISPTQLFASGPSQSVVTEAATKAATASLPAFAQSPAFAQAVTAATKATDSVPDFTSNAFKSALQSSAPSAPELQSLSPDAIKSVASETVKAIPPQQTIEAAQAASQSATTATSQASEALNIQRVSGLRNIGAPEADPSNFIVHHTGPGISTPGQLNNVLNQRGLGVQYTVDKNGNVFQLTPQPNSREPHTLPSDLNTKKYPFQSLGAPKGVSNDNSIGVEVMAANDKAVTEAQKIATAKLYDQLKTQYPNLKNVYGHGEVNPGHKEADEGKTIADYIRQNKDAGSAAAAAAKPSLSQPQTVQLDKSSLDALTKGPLPPNAYNRSIPAAIRTNNPSAMWPGPSASKYTSLPYQQLNDGQGNRIAQFPTPEAGAAAQFDLLNSPKYANLSLDQAIAKWSGGNSSAAYSSTLAKQLGASGNTKLGDLLKEPQSAIKLAQTQAKWESGKPFPMSDQQWQNAYQLYQSKNGVLPSQSGATADNPWGNFSNGFANENSLFPKQSFGSTPSPAATDYTGFGSSPSLASPSNTDLLTSFGSTAGASSSFPTGSFGAAPVSGFTGGTASAIPGLGTGAGNAGMFQGLNASLSQASQSAQQAAAGVQQLSSSTASVGQASQTAQSSLQGMDQATTSIGQQVQSVTPQLTQMGTSFQQATPQISALTNSTGSVTSGFGGLDGSLSGIMGPLSSATSGLGSFGSSISSFVQQLASSAGGLGGGGGGGGFGGLFSFFGGLFADGGEIKGPGTGRSDSIMAQVSNGEFIVNASSAQKNLPLLHLINNDKLPGNTPKFANGGEVGGMSARSLSYRTGQKAASRGIAQPSTQIAALSDQVGVLTKAMNTQMSSAGGRNTSIAQNITVHANDAGSFRRSESQLTSDAFLKMNRAAKRNG